MLLAFHYGYGLNFPIKLNVFNKNMDIHFKKILKMKTLQVVFMKK